MTSYITAAEFEDRHRITDVATRARIPATIAAASRDVDWRTGRTFGQQTEVQTLTPGGTISGGSFTLTMLGTVTAAIAWDATAAIVQAAVDTAIPGNTIVVAGGPVNSTAVTFTFIGYGDVTTITVTSSLTGSTPTLTASSANPAAVRYFTPTSPCLCYIDDCYSITTVDVDWGNAGTYATAWTATDYQTLPLNGVGADGQAGWSAYAIESFGFVTFPVGYRRPSVKVTGKWGWATIPDAIREATHLLANRLMFENDVPSGIVAGELGGVPLRRQWTAEDLLRPFVRGDRMIGVAG